MSIGPLKPEACAALDDAAAELVDALQTVFEGSFDCWRREHRTWVRLSRELTLNDREIAFDRIASMSKPQCVDVGPEKFITVRFVDKLGDSLISVGRLNSRTPRWAMMTANTLLRGYEARNEVAQLHDQVAACNVQMSRDFEELAYLREVAEHLDLSGESDSLIRSAERIFPLLRRTVEAESLSLVLASQTDLTTLHDGATIHSDELVSYLVRNFGRSADAPVVANHVSSSEYADQLGGVNRFILVQIAKGAEIIGWLIAINRESDVPNRSNEFGTVEAGILSTTASILATLAQNNVGFSKSEGMR